MKRNTIITFLALATVVAIVTTACRDKRDTGRAYMPDMAYSRAVETYAPLDSSFSTDSSEFGHKIFYNRMPVDSTIKRGELFPYPYQNDSIGYIKSATVKNPLEPLTGADSAEASRLFNINCGVCHGADGKASGPIAKGGKLGGIKDLTADEAVQMADGTIYHIMTYGKNNMGSYASQLDRKQRWQIVQYIRTLQPKAEAKGAVADTTAKK